MPGLERVKINFYTGYKIQSIGCCEVLKRHQYEIIPNISVGGDAPKSILKVYEYGKARKTNRKKWPIYIAKTGQKWYPSESVTEHLLTRLGGCFGLNMAKCRLSMINGQIRFLSRYFLKEDERLVHGAEIYAGQLSDDKDFVEAIEREQLARDFFTIQFTRDAIQATFPEEANEILRNFVLMLLYDALVGNNDRHFYNWAIIQNIENKSRPVFSPIYDTARGLFWNTPEKKILSLRPGSKELKVFIDNYYKKSKPKIGLDGIKDINHFDLANFIVKNEFGILKSEIHSFFNNGNLQKACNLIDSDFGGLYSKARLSFIKNCITERFYQIFNF